MKKVLSMVLALVFMFLLCSCAELEEQKIDTTSKVVESVESKSAEVTSKITSLDNKMAKYFDITLFDEENYSSVYLGEKFDFKTTYDNSEFALPTKISELEEEGWKLSKGSDYDKNSLIYAKETVELTFINDNKSKITALFYNALNTSMRLSECNIVKFHISNGFVKNPDKYSAFNINGITNTSVITDIIQILGTPSHFYKKSESSYYFDYFIEETDRRNKIRVYVNLVDDAVTAIEVSNYKI